MSIKSSNTMSPNAATKNCTLRPSQSWSNSEEKHSIELSREPGDGANDPGEDYWDDVQYGHGDLFRSETERTDNDRANNVPFYAARTTFMIAGQNNPDHDPTRWRRLKRLQHGVGPDYSGQNLTRTVIRRNDRYQRYDAILQALEVPSQVRTWSIRRAFSENVVPFNGHYNGYHGAVLGFALLELTDDLDEALSSKWFEQMEALIDELPERDVNLNLKSLAEYVFENYAYDGVEA